jgi:hypothetical protein
MRIDFQVFLKTSIWEEVARTKADNHYMRRGFTKKSRLPLYRKWLGAEK